MFTKSDIDQIKARGSTLGDIEKQVQNFRDGFPYLHLVKAATVGDGILRLTPGEAEKYISIYDDRREKGLGLLKFTPASGAASRMFQALFSALDETKSGKTDAQIMETNNGAAVFFRNLPQFAFYGNLDKAIKAKNKDMTLRSVIELLLTPKGLNYGALPKGLLLFHNYPEGPRTPFDEHLVEGALYASANKTVRLHFTVSPEHMEAFEKQKEMSLPQCEEKFGVTYEIGFSVQKPSTDTIAVTTANEPFRNSDGSLLFRPAGHGALLENLNELDADLIFIKNIDNVTTDDRKGDTVFWKKALAGLLLKYQERIFRIQKELNEKHYTALDSAFLAEAAGYLEKELFTIPPENLYYTEKEELYQYLREKYNRPLRICGMVPNQGEPGGGPFWARNSDYTISLQVVESSQIDFNNPAQSALARQSTHFNPVDLVCGVKNYKGEKYNLAGFSDPLTGFISLKSKDGKELKAQELPGLWNGAMSNWITLFVEVPVTTFSPVKTVNDLLRNEHQ